MKIGSNATVPPIFRLIERCEYSTIQMYAFGVKTYLPGSEHRYKIAHRLNMDADAREILWSKR